MIDFKNKLLRPEQSADSSKPVIEVTIDTLELRNELNVNTNVELFALLSGKDESSFITGVFMALHQQIQDNENSVDVEVKALIEEIKTADKITYQEWPCGSCGDTGGGTRWRRVCQNGHCWCPRC